MEIEYSKQGFKNARRYRSTSGIKQHRGNARAGRTLVNVAPRRKEEEELDP